MRRVCFFAKERSSSTVKWPLWMLQSLSIAELYSAPSPDGAVSLTALPFDPQETRDVGLLLTPVSEATYSTPIAPVIDSKRRASPEEE